MVIASRIVAVAALLAAVFATYSLVRAFAIAVTWRERQSELADMKIFGALAVLLFVVAGSLRWML